MSLYSILRGKKSEIWPRFLTSVAFEALWFRNRIENLKHPSVAVMIGLPFDSDVSSSPTLIFTGGSKSAKFDSSLDFQTIQFRNEEVRNRKQLVGSAMTVLCTAKNWFSSVPYL